MRYILHLLCLTLCCFLSLGVRAGVLDDLSRALSEENWTVAEKLFKEAIGENADRAADFFWVNTKEDCILRKKMARALGDYYKKCRNYEKAYPFYKELIRLDPKNIDYLSVFAETQVLTCRETEALTTYETILSLDIDHLAANIFTGNYYYYQTRKKEKRLKNDYRKISSPTRMQVAAYKDSLEELLNTGYAKALVYLQRVMASFPSTEIQKTLDKIKRFEWEVNR